MHPTFHIVCFYIAVEFENRVTVALDVGSRDQLEITDATASSEIQSVTSEVSRAFDLDYNLDSCRCDEVNSCIDESSLIRPNDNLRVCVSFGGDVLPPTSVKLIQ